MQSLRDFSIKAVSSCIRFPAQLGLGQSNIVEANNFPRSGDIVLLRCTESAGAYTSIETLSGQNTQLFVGDLFIGVLGDRFSGTNVFGVMPRTPIGVGMRLDLVAAGGVVAHSVEVPGYCGGKTSSAEVVGFPVTPRGKKLNIDGVGPLAHSLGSMPRYDCIVVCGTSAEVGKTTMTCSIGRQIKAICAEFRVGAIKACGTGRIKDIQSYQKAGFDAAIDYVDFGLVTTYGLPEEKFIQTLEKMTNYVGKQTDVLMLEIGGDLYEANAPAALKYGSELGAQFILVVNDAMGATEALRVLGKENIMPTCIASFKQNMHSLKARLQQNAPFYLDMNRPSDLIEVVSQRILPRLG